MKKLNCLIVEDEPLAAEVLEEYVQQTPQLHLVAVCIDALFALEILQKQTVDVIFLDIHLPKLKGLDFLKTLTDSPQVILTTAYHQYALEGYELDVVDYLLKPIAFNRFLQAVNKLRLPAAEPAPSGPVIAKGARPYRFFNVNKKNVKVFLDEILYIESLKDYLRIHTTSLSHVTKGQLTEVEKELADLPLLRIHRSYLVSIAHIEAYNATQVEIGGRVLPIGRSYKELVWRTLNG